MRKILDDLDAIEIFSGQPAGVLFSAPLVLAELEELVDDLCDEMRDGLDAKIAWDRVHGEERIERMKEKLAWDKEHSAEHSAEHVEKALKKEAQNHGVFLDNFVQVLAASPEEQTSELKTGMEKQFTYPLKEDANIRVNVHIMLGTGEGRREEKITGVITDTQGKDGEITMRWGKSLTVKLQKSQIVDITLAPSIPDIPLAPKRVIQPNREKENDRGR
jgi:hypothetical protein